MRLLYSLSAPVLLAALVLAACNSTENRGNKAGDSSNNSAARVTTTTPPPPPSSSPGHVAPADGVKRVTTIETRDAVEKGEAIIVDVRGDAAYKQSHIKGSISIPGEQVEARLSQLPRDKMIVTYCS